MLEITTLGLFRWAFRECATVSSSRRLAIQCLIGVDHDIRLVAKAILGVTESKSERLTSCIVDENVHVIDSSHYLVSKRQGSQTNKQVD